jgi:cobalt-zinc-cadmium efflux system protein
MAHDHDHGADRSSAAKNKNRLALVLGLTTLYLVAEIVGGFLTGSLALLADAGHMLTDAGGLALALFAIWLAEKPATPERTYGYYRAEILAALTNAVVLVGVSFYVLYEAYQRFKNPPEVASGTMLWVALIGLCVNFVGLLLLRKSSKESLNLKGAYFEVVADLLTSVGVIVAAVVMWATDWYYADPLISAGIGLFIIPRTWLLLKDAVGILLEGTPSSVNIANLRAALEAIPGVTGIHDLHVWALTSGINAMSVHIVLKELSLHQSVLTQVQKRVSTDFRISHVTVQTELEGCEKTETHL